MFGSGLSRALQNKNPSDDHKNIDGIETTSKLIRNDDQHDSSCSSGFSSNNSSDSDSNNISGNENHRQKTL